MHFAVTVTVTGGLNPWEFHIVSMALLYRFRRSYEISRGTFESFSLEF